MLSLPPAIKEVPVPDYFSPSALWASRRCRLRLNISSLRNSEWNERLAVGPAAAVGTLFHRVLERTGSEVANSPEEIFQQEYDRAVDDLRRDPGRAHYAELASTKSLAEWRRLKAWVLSRASRPDGLAPPRAPRASASKSMAGAEVDLESRQLRLRGRADRIRRLGPRAFEVRDFKTGSTIDEHGAIKEGIALQLQAYGLLLLEREPRADVRLLVDDGEEREVPFDLDTRRRVADELSGITGAMPSAGWTAAEALASPGSVCLGCAVRHVCPAYRASAPGWWKNYPREIDRLPNDVWGTALEVIGQGRVDVVLRDEVGRRVRIDAISERHGVTSAIAGERLWLFGLQASGATRGFDGARFHPRSFHELPRDRMERRAWELQIFCGQSDEGP